MEKELVHFNPWHSPESGQFISGPGGTSSKGSIFQRRKQKKAMEKAKKAEAERLAKMSPSEKAAETRRRKAEHEADKKKAIESGDPRQISKYTSELSNEELKRAKDRITYVKDINKEASELAIKEAQNGLTLEQLTKKANDLMNAYDTVAMINNTFSNTKLPRVPKDVNNSGNKGPSYFDSISEITNRRKQEKINDLSFDVKEEQTKSKLRDEKIKKMEQDNKIREAKIKKQRLKQEEQNLKEVKSKETKELKKKEKNK